MVPGKQTAINGWAHGSVNGVSPGQADVGHDAQSIQRLLEQATMLNLRAPELAMVLGERASAIAYSTRANSLWVRAEGLVVSARVRLGHRADSVARGLAALEAADKLGDSTLAAKIRIDLTICARSAGLASVGIAALRPVLAVPELSPIWRAAALIQLAGCWVQAKPQQLERLFTEADRLCDEASSLSTDARLVTKALIRVAMSACHRRLGDLAKAVSSAQHGLRLLEQLQDFEVDGGAVRSRLMLQLVCAHLDRSDAAAAHSTAEAVLSLPIRAAAVAPMGWLRLALATRVLTPAGHANSAAVLLRETVQDAERHELPGLSAKLWLALAEIEEAQGNLTEAIACLRHSHQANHLHHRFQREACLSLAGYFGESEASALDVSFLTEPTRSFETTQPPDSIASPEPIPSQSAYSTSTLSSDYAVSSSVLERLGIAANEDSRSSRTTPSRRGKRRAPEVSGDQEPPVDVFPWANGRPVGEPSTRPSRKPARESTPAEPEWLPRLKLPPSLTSLIDSSEAAGGFSWKDMASDTPSRYRDETYDFDALGSEKSRGEKSYGDPSTSKNSADDSYPGTYPDFYSESRYEHEYDDVIATDEPDENAGLADLLARALAEHRAGTSSAAALVKKLGEQNNRLTGSRSVNGVNGSVNGRHREKA